MVGIIGQWFRLNSLAVYLADSQAKFGIHTMEAERIYDQFRTYSTLQNFDAEVSNSAGAALFGKDVWATVYADFHFQIGQLVNVPVVRIGAEGRSISTYRGLYDAGPPITPSP